VGDTADPESRSLRWRARAAMAELDCRTAPARAREALGQLHQTLKAQFPQGGQLVAEVERARQACASAQVAAAP
jgi:serine/threonine-protein kinase